MNRNGSMWDTGAIDLNPWEVWEFSWGCAIKHSKGSWDCLYLSPDGKEIDVSGINVDLSNWGIEILN